MKTRGDNMSKRNDIINFAISETKKVYQNYENRISLNKVPELVDQSGFMISNIEEFLRPYWGLGAFYKDDVSIKINVKDKPIELSEYLKSSLIDIISQKIPSSLDIHNFAFQAVTEFAAFLVGAYFSREKLWDVFSKEEQDKIAKRIHKLCKITDEINVTNNHIWFPAICLFILDKLGYKYPEKNKVIDKAFTVLDNMYLGNGLYGDGGARRIDYYNSYSIHLYPLLYFIITESKKYDKKKYLKRTEEFISKYVYLFDNDGDNVQFGRSISYTYAAVAIFPIAIMAGCNIDVSIANKIYISNILRQSYENKCSQMATLETYMSTGTSTWSFKAFLGLLLSENDSFWTITSSKNTFENVAKIDKIGLAVTRNDYSVTLINNLLDYDDKNSHCFSDMASLYGKFAYNSKSGITLSSADKRSFDSMISLITPDRCMASSRRHFEIIKNTESSFISCHIPFPNDPETKIITKLVPLYNGWHIRLHKVILSRPYIVHEGGFSIPTFNDYRNLSYSDNVVTLFNDSYKSIMTAIGTVPFKYGKEFSHHGLNTISSLTLNPYYETDVLESGIYHFVSAYTLTGQYKALTIPNIEQYFDDYTKVL